MNAHDQEEQPRLEAAAAHRGYLFPIWKVRLSMLSGTREPVAHIAEGPVLAASGGELDPEGDRGWRGPEGGDGQRPNVSFAVAPFVDADRRPTVPGAT